MPKAKNPENISLPQRWRWRHGAIRYQVPPGQEHEWMGRKEFTLGRTFEKAVAMFKNQLLGKKKISQIHSFFSVETLLGQAFPIATHYVYFLFDGPEVIYVGQSVNVFNRIQAHYEKPHNKVAIIPVPAEYATLIEAEYIKRFKPKYNITDNPDADL